MSQSQTTLVSVPQVLYLPDIEIRNIENTRNTPVLLTRNSNILFFPTRTKLINTEEISATFILMKLNLIKIYLDARCFLIHLREWIETFCFLSQVDFQPLFRIKLKRSHFLWRFPDFPISHSFLIILSSAYFYIS